MIDPNQLGAYGVFEYDRKYTYHKDPSKGYNFCLFNNHIFQCTCSDVPDDPINAPTCWRLVTMIHDARFGYDKGMIMFNVQTSTFHMAKATVPTDVALTDENYWERYDARFVNIHSLSNNFYKKDTLVWSKEENKLYIAVQDLPIGTTIQITDTDYWKRYDEKYVLSSEANVAGGYATLDADAKIPTNMLSNDVDLSYDSNNGTLTLKRLFLADQTINLPFNDLLDRDNPPFYDEITNKLTLTWEVGGTTEIDLTDLVDYNTWFYGTTAERDALTTMQKNDMFMVTDVVDAPKRYRYDGTDWVSDCCGQPLRVHLGVNWTSYHHEGYLGYVEHEQEPVFSRTAYLPKLGAIDSTVFRVNVREYGYNIDEVVHTETLADGTNYKAVAYNIPVTGIYKVVSTLGIYGEITDDTSIGSLELKVVDGTSYRITQFILYSDDTDIPYMQSFKGVAHVELTKDDIILFGVKGLTCGFLRDANLELELIEQTEI